MKPVNASRTVVGPTQRRHIDAPVASVSLHGRIKPAASIAVERSEDRSESVVRPDFLVVALPDDPATAWLRGRLADHPEVHLPKNTESRFFTLGSPRTDPRRQATPPPNGRRVRGEFVPMQRPMEAWRIRIARQMLPDARLVILVDDPVTAAWRRATADRTRGAALPGPPDLEALIERSPSLRPGVVADMVEHWTASFGAVDTFPLRAGDLLRDPRGSLDAVAHHLQLGCAALGHSAPLPPVAPIPPSQRALLLGRYADELVRLADLLGERPRVAS